MPINNQKKIIVFEVKDKSTNSLIREILNNNGLEETSYDYLQKARNGKEPWFKTLNNLSLQLASADVTEENFLILLQNRLQVNQQTAKNILKEVKQKLLPLARTLEGDELEKESSEPVLPTQTSSPTNNPPKINQDSGYQMMNDDISIASKQPKIKKTTTVDNSPPQPKRPKGPDKYREPVE